MAPKRDFQKALQSLFDDAMTRGESSVTVRASDLHRLVGGYPGSGHAMPTCCSAMVSTCVPRIGDTVIDGPKQGKGASLTIRYTLPRCVPLGGPTIAHRASGEIKAVQPALGRQNIEHLHGKFLEYVNSLQPAFERLLEMTPLKPLELPKAVPRECIYLFSDHGQPLYVGRTKNLPRRMRNHCGQSSGQNQAVFAFKLTREKAGRRAASYTAEGSRKALIADPAFASAFSEAKHRIRNMELRFVAEADPLRQALLEIYVSVVLETPYNDFDTH